LVYRNGKLNTDIFLNNSVGILIKRYNKGQEEENIVEKTIDTTQLQN